jgi:hypothetical protein
MFVGTLPPAGVATSASALRTTTDAYSGLSFYGGVAYPCWSDNSNSTGTNPDGALNKLDIYTAAVPG